MNGDGSPPWGPADPVPDLDDTQAIPGLGSIPGPSSEGAGSWAGADRAEEPAADGEKGQKNGNKTDGNKIDGSKTDEETGDETGGKRPKGRKGKRRKRRSFWRELPVLILVALALAFLIKTFVIEPFWIPSGSMQNTLAINDRVLINKFIYHLRSIHRGDIVVFDGSTTWDAGSAPTNSGLFSKAVSEIEGIVGISNDPHIYIKRVIGLPGDHVVCCNTQGQITVNGVALSESPYLYPGNVPSLQKFSITVPAGSLWVMGDHRAISYDSRGHTGDPGGGSIPESAVLGRAFWVVWPPSQWSVLNIPATFEQPQLNASTGNAAAGGSNAAAVETALDEGTPLRSAGSPLPLALGFVGAVPLTWLQRKVRTRRRSRKSKP
jgi:signal peptidase I